MILESPGLPAHPLDRPLRPYSFPGELPLHAHLIAGPATDLNLMTRHGAVVATLRTHTAAVELSQSNDLLLIGHTRCFRIEQAGVPTRMLAADHLLHLSSVRGPVSLMPLEQGAAMLCAAIDPAASIGQGSGFNGQ